MKYLSIEIWSITMAFWPVEGSDLLYYDHFVEVDYLFLISFRRKMDVCLSARCMFILLSLTSAQKDLCVVNVVFDVIKMLSTIV